MDCQPEKETQAITNWVKHHSYPEYIELYNMLAKHANAGNLYFLDMCAEYGEQNHIFCKIIYENPHDKALIIEMGKSIYLLGGADAMAHNLRVLAMIFNRSETIAVKRHWQTVEAYWQEDCFNWVA